jgi:ribosomal protein S18 acetylase RimI-like enzyme
VQALVVDQACRGEAVGRIMMAAAESWARDRAFMSVALATDIGRSAAHTFYKRLGYQCLASSTLFRNDLNREAKIHQRPHEPFWEQLSASSAN